MQKNNKKTIDMQGQNVYIIGKISTGGYFYDNFENDDRPDQQNIKNQ